MATSTPIKSQHSTTKTASKPQQNEPLSSQSTGTNYALNETLDVTAEGIEVPLAIANLSFSTSQKKLKLLPVDCVNEHPSQHVSVNRKVYNGCIILEGKFDITDKQWHTIFKNGKFVKRMYPYYFRNRITKYVNNVCNIAFYKWRALKNNKYLIFAYCRNNYYRCKNFKTVILPSEQQFLTAHVYSSSKNYCHPYKITSAVKGVERDLTQNKLIKMQPLRFRQKTVSLSNMHLTAAGNLQLIAN